VIDAATTQRFAETKSMDVRISKEPQASTSHLNLIQQAIAVVLADDHKNGKWRREWTQEYGTTHRVRLAHDVALIRRFAKKSDKICEVGALPLFLTIALKKEGFDVTGIDISPERLASTISKAALRVLKCDIEHQAVPFADCTFDVVVFNELFEHLRINPIFTLGEVRRVTKRTGVMLLSTPNLRSIVGIRNFLFRNKSYSCCDDVYDEFDLLNVCGHMGHVREYTTAEVIGFLRKVGFEVEELIFRGSFDRALYRAVCAAIPSMRPFVTYVARPVL
jgi:SAM-dependent methyltransferase